MIYVVFVQCFAGIRTECSGQDRILQHQWCKEEQLDQGHQYCEADLEQWNREGEQGTCEVTFQSSA